MYLRRGGSDGRVKEVISSLVLSLILEGSFLGVCDRGSSTWGGFSGFGGVVMGSLRIHGGFR